MSSAESQQPNDKGVGEMFSSTISEARGALDSAGEAVNSAISSAAKAGTAAALQFMGIVGEVARDGLETGSRAAEEAKGYADLALSEAKRVEDLAVAQLKVALDLVAANPYVSYPLIATGSLMVLPGTRRFLYRATLGRLRSADNIIKGSEGKVEGLKVKMADYSNEAKKLQERMVTAEEEYVRGRAKLKATRQELQRLASVVAKSERAASGVLEDLRAIKKVDKATQLRAEAASQVSALKAQRTALQSYIYRIATKDI